MTVYRKGNDLIIKLPNNIHNSELTGKGSTKQAEIDLLAKEVNTNWWAQNKDRFLND